MKKLRNSLDNFGYIYSIAIVLVVWIIISGLNILDSFILPSPLDVVEALFSDIDIIFSHTLYTLLEAIIGIGFSIILGLALSLIMDRYDILYKLIHPILIITQTVPSIAMAPLLILWFGFGMLPKVILIILTCIFPITIATINGLRNVDVGILNFYRSIGVNENKILFFIKLPMAMRSFFSGLRISISYAIVGAVIAEWLGGNMGIGVYMTRVRKAYAFDKMFAAIFVISILSICLVRFVEFLEKKFIYWED